jgi:hypothetical protein
MGIGYGEGEHRSVEAATNAISSPLLEDVSIEGATGIIINITGNSSLSIHEVNEATTLIMEAAHEDAEIIFGTVIDEALKDRVKVTVIATGLGPSGAAAMAHARSMESMTSVPAAKPSQPIELQQPSPESMYSQGATVQETMSLPPTPTPQMLAAARAMLEDTAESHEPPQPQLSENGELARARAIAQRLGITNLTDDEYDVPAYMRRQQEREF